MLNKDTGFILDGSCTCKASAMGRCSHVSSLLFAIEDYLINNGNMPTSCTSQPCKWNKGASLKTSSEVMLKQYSYKRDVSIIKEFFPIADRTNAKESVNCLLRICEAMPIPTMWNLILQYQYEDYQISTQREAILTENVLKLKKSLLFNMTSVGEIPGTSQLNNPI